MLAVACKDLKIGFQQPDERQERRGFSKGIAVSLQDLNIGAGRNSEFVNQARLADTGLAYYRDYLPAARPDLYQRVLELLAFVPPPDESRQTAPGCRLQPGLQRTDPEYFVDFKRIPNPFDGSRPKCAELEVALCQLEDVVGDHHGTDRGHGLHTRRETHLVPDRRIFGALLISLNRAQHNVARLIPTRIYSGGSPRRTSASEKAS